MSKITSVQRIQLKDKLNIVMQKRDRNDRNALFILENCGGYKNRFFLAFFRLADFFPAAFQLMLKIHVFSLAAKFGGLGSTSNTVSNVPNAALHCPRPVATEKSRPKRS